eukprot:Gb_36349 [translate_table: standard]
MSNHHLDWLKEWGDGAFIFKGVGLHFPSRWWAKQGRWRAKSYRLEVVRDVGLWVFMFWKKVCRSLIMGGEPVTSEPSVLKIDDDVRSILEEASLLSFKKILRHSDSITNQFVESWKDGRVLINGLEFVVSEVLIVEASSLPNEGVAISRDKMNQGGSLGDEVSHSGREIPEAIRLSHSHPKFHEEHGKSEHSPLFAQIHGEKSTIAGPSKGDFVRVSGAPISKAQLLLGPAPSSSLLISGDTASDSDGDSRSPEGNCPTTNPKEKGGRKRKPPAQVLSTNIAKCSRRSSRLQRKVVGKTKFVDDAEYSEKERKSDDPSSLGGRSNPSKVTVVAPLEKGAKSSEGSYYLSKELRCHLRVVKGLSGSLTSTYAFINLLTLEITNYLKEVVKNMKDLNAAE